MYLFTVKAIVVRYRRDNTDSLGIRKAINCAINSTGNIHSPEPSWQVRRPVATSSSTRRMFHLQP